MSATIIDIARAAGVSTTTVFRALHDVKYVSAKTQARIRKIAADMNYMPNHIARSLVLGRSSLVSVIATPRLMHFMESIVETVENKLREAGYSMLFNSTPAGSRASRELQMQQLLQNRVAGVVAFPDTNTEAATYQMLVDAGVKMVILDSPVEGLEVPQVHGDNYRAGRVATEHLISLGHRRIVYLAMPQTSLNGRARIQGFRDAMVEAGIPITSGSIVETPFSESGGEEVMARLLQRKKPPTAIIARHDVVAFGAMRAILAAGLSIPNDISIVGNGDVQAVDLLCAPLTTVRHPVRQMVDIGIQRLLDLLDGEPMHAEDIVLDVRLIVRSSCAPPRSD